MPKKVLSSLPAKPVVHYLHSEDNFIKVGKAAMVQPIDHPDKENVSNTKMVITSRVVKLLPKGFETENTIYEAVLQ